MTFLNFYKMYFTVHSYYFIFCFCFIGACLGSFMSLVGVRYPRIYEANLLQQCLEFLQHKKSPLVKDKNIEDYLDKGFPGIAFPGSFCDLCNKKLKWYENVPLFGYLSQLGKCRCKKFKIPPTFFLTELFFCLIAGSIAYKFGPTIDAFMWLIFWFFMGCLLWIDAKSKWLPETFINPVVAIGLIGIFLHIKSLPSLEQGIGSALGIYLFLFLIVKFFALVFRREGMGMGDLQLFGVIGIWMGYQHILQTLILSCLFGLVFGIIYKRKHQEEQFPFGPAIIVATYIIWALPHIPEIIR